MATTSGWPPRRDGHPVPSFGEPKEQGTRDGSQCLKHRLRTRLLSSWDFLHHPSHILAPSGSVPPQHTPQPSQSPSPTSFSRAKCAQAGTESPACPPSPVPARPRPRAPIPVSSAASAVRCDRPEASPCCLCTTLCVTVCIADVSLPGVSSGCPAPRPQPVQIIIFFCSFFCCFPFFFLDVISGD